MSTRERYGSEVWRAVLELSFKNGVNMMPLLSVGEVSHTAGVSRATARKYLMDMVRYGSVSTFPVGKRWVYQCIFDGSGG